MITKEELSEKLITIIKTYIPEEEMPNSIDLNLDLTNDLGINSMHLIDIIIDIENEFDIIITDEEIRKMTSGNKAIEVILAKLSETES